MVGFAKVSTVQNVASKNAVGGHRSFLFGAGNSSPKGELADEDENREDWHFKNACTFRGGAGVVDNYEFSWHPGIGDPTIAGWVTVALYLLASVSCWMTMGCVRRQNWNDKSDAHIWRIISVFFFILGINKQLDLQSGMTELGRMLAYSEGWYERRQAVQIYFVVSVAAVCLAIIPAFIYWVRTSPIQMWIALVGSTFVLGYVLIRAASFHHLDSFFRSRFLGLKWYWILEMAGIVIVLLASEWRRAKVVQQIGGRVAS